MADVDSTTSLASMALQLASAKNGDGEYILGEETRVECSKCQGFGWYNSSRGQGRLDCGFFGCEGRGWNPLNPMLLGRWQVALAEAGRVISVWPPGALVDDETDTHNEGWMSAYWGGPSTESPKYDTPEEAFFPPAMRSLGLEVEA